ncbi:MAG: type II secretion system F family protein [Actinobacteria bacterium]|nr:type II secretion system F family protein [Actinomycetota bacterium]
MMTGLQLALVGGGLLGGGVSLAVVRLVRVRPDLADVVGRLSPDQGGRAGRSVDLGGVAPADRLGRWGVRMLPAAIWGRPLDQELALLRIPLMRFYGQKLLVALVGGVAAPLLSLLFVVLGWRLPLLLPVGATALLAAGLFLLPNHNVRDDAQRARSEFIRTLGAYIDLVALERSSGSGPRQALEVAAAVGDSWVFRRLREELAYSSWSGEQPWDALRRLSYDLGVTELADLADIMRLSGEEGAQVYGQLRARSTAMRTAMLNDEVAVANAVGEKLSIPMSLLGVIFLVILVTPALLRVMAP